MTDSNTSVIELTHEGGRVRLFLMPQGKKLRLVIRGEADDFSLDTTIPVSARLTQPDGAFDQQLALVQGAEGDETRRIKSLLLLARATTEGPRAEALLRRLADWIIESSETSNFTYALTPRSIRHAAHTVALVTGDSFEAITGLFEEVEGADHLKAHMRSVLQTLPDLRRLSADPEARLGRRLVWYALARLLKPRLIVETGVDQGFGSLVLCEALRRNAEEGVQGRYIGTDKREDAGQYLTGIYRSFGEIMYGDSLESLNGIEGPIDLFINDSDHSAEYEAQEYRAVAQKLSPHAVLLGDNAHATTKLDEFAVETGRQFTFFREQPAGHWYPGAGVGVAWTPGCVRQDQV